MAKGYVFVDEWDVDAPQEASFPLKCWLVVALGPGS